jgi:predicted DNA-binding protein (MmcQ/YjbR family)
MTIAELRDICLSFPAVTEDIKWTDPDNVPVSASFKTSDEDFAALPNRKGFIPAPYMAHNKWIFVDDINRFSKKEWETYARNSYDLIVSKLSLKFQREIAGGLPVSKAVPKKKKAAAKKKVVKKKAAKKTVRRKKK